MKLRGSALSISFQGKKDIIIDIHRGSSLNIETFSTKIDNFDVRELINIKLMKRKTNTGSAAEYAITSEKQTLKS